MKLKMYEYDFSVTWGMGQGVVIAENEDEAKEIIKNSTQYCNPYSEEVTGKAKKNKITLKEIDPTKKQVIDASYSE